MLRKIKSLWFDSPQYIVIAFLVIAIVALVLFVSQPDFASSLKIYFQKPITKMSIGELVMWLWFISDVFSREKRG